MRIETFRIENEIQIHNKSITKGGVLVLSKKMKLFVFVFMMLIIVAGCATNRGGTVKQQQVRTQEQIIPKDRVEIATEASVKITQVPGVHKANVIMIGKNAYVAVVLNSDHPLTSDLENQIAQQVKSTDPTILNVYVSVNPDFVSRVQTYVEDVRLGKPVTGFYNEFTEIVRRVFPTAH
jgi:YhcN/YlaJ family sporulation lipoprotein